MVALRAESLPLRYLASTSFKAPSYTACCLESFFQALSSECDGTSAAIAVSSSESTVAESSAAVAGVEDELIFSPEVVSRKVISVILIGRESVD